MGFIEDDFWEDEDYDEDDMGQGSVIPCATEEEARNEFIKFIHGDGKHGVSFAILVENNGLKLHTRWSQPCYGELCLYGSASPNLPDVKKPGDLNTPFPDGVPVWIAAPLTMHSFGYHYTKDKDATFKEVLEYMYSDTKGPWRKVKKQVIREEGNIIGVIFDADQEPTTVVNLLMNTRNNTGCIPSFLTVKKYLPNLSEAQWFFLSTHVFGIYEAGYRIPDPNHPWKSLSTSPGFMFNAEFLRGNTYFLSHYKDIGKYFSGEFFDLTGGTFRDRYSYNRPSLHKIFGDDDARIVNAGKEFYQKLKAKYSPKMLAYQCSTAPIEELSEIHDELCRQFPEYANA